MILEKKKRKNKSDHIDQKLSTFKLIAKRDIESTIQKLYLFEQQGDPYVDWKSKMTIFPTHQHVRAKVVDGNEATYLHQNGDLSLSFKFHIVNNTNQYPVDFLSGIEEITEYCQKNISDNIPKIIEDMFSILGEEFCFSNELCVLKKKKDKIQKEINKIANEINKLLVSQQEIKKDIQKKSYKLSQLNSELEKLQT